MYFSLYTFIYMHFFIHTFIYILKYAFTLLHHNICQKLSIYVQLMGFPRLGALNSRWFRRFFRTEAFGGFKGRSEVPPLIDDYEARIGTSGRFRDPGFGWDVGQSLGGFFAQSHGMNQPPLKQWVFSYNHHC